MDETQMFDLLRRISLDSAWGVLNQLGYPNQFCEGLQVVRPDLLMVGRAVTIRCLPIRRDLAEQVRARGPMLNARAAEEARPGDVLVVDAGGETGAGFLGDVIAARFIYNGGAGMVIDGALRDLQILGKMPLPLYLKAAHAAGSGRRILPVDYNVPVRVGNVTVLPGDVLMGDAEGVLVIPRALAEQVAREALATDHQENFLRGVLEQGRSIYGVYPPDEAILAEYEAYLREHPVE
ncbi:MAG: hypothetical protein HY320_13700 [Armatimonadetes bacterium]|nr:hypothetical protein [Armatimonadota bacterium]